MYSEVVEGKSAPLENDYLLGKESTIVSLPTPNLSVKALCVTRDLRGEKLLTRERGGGGGG